MNRRLTILFCPLDWGLGHITRDVPLIQYCVNEGHKVIVAGSEKVIQIAKEACPTITTELFTGFEIIYSKKRGIIIGLLLKLPDYIVDFYNDHKKTEALADKHNVDLVISDNRFGCYSKEAYSVYISHQLQFRLKGIAKPFNFIPAWVHRQIIKKYNHCLIPDFETKPRLAGELSEKKRLRTPATYIGILSRFEPKTADKTEDTVVLLGGPEPYRTQFEHIIINQANEMQIPVTIIQGKPDTNHQKTTIGFVKRVSMLTGDELENRLLTAKTIISRSGYSSLMDLAALNRTAVIVPTPGQPEQEYLARYLHQSGYFVTMSQQAFNLKTATELIAHKLTFDNRTHPIFANTLQKIFNQLY